MQKYVIDPDKLSDMMNPLQMFTLCTKSDSHSIWSGYMSSHMVNKFESEDNHDPVRFYVTCDPENQSILDIVYNIDNARPLMLFFQWIKTGFDVQQATTIFENQRIVSRWLLQDAINFFYSSSLEIKNKLIYIYNNILYDNYGKRYH